MQFTEKQEFTVNIKSAPLTIPTMQLIANLFYLYQAGVFVRSHYV